LLFWSFLLAFITPLVADFFLIKSSNYL
jgi:hypothetical protein